MKPKINWNEIETKISFESVAEKLLNLSASGGLNHRKSASNVLDKVKEALLKARNDGASFAALAEFLNSNGLPVSVTTVRESLRRQGVNRKSKSKLKKGDPETVPAMKTKTHPQSSEPKSSDQENPIDVGFGESKKPRIGKPWTF